MHSPILLFRFKILKANLSALLRNFYISESILRLPFLSNYCVLYTLWFDEWATNLSILKKRNKIKNYMSLAHGFDIYEERTPDTKKIAFRWFQLKYVNRVYSVSKIGEDYLKNRYPQYADKIKTAYLQTNYKGRNKLSAGTNTILTCANFHLVKRLNLIPEILKHINIEITWILIGQMNNDDENVRKFLNEVEVVCKNYPLVQIKIMGELSNEDVFDFYLKNSVNVLLSVSQSEGLPVSMMEAISFGVPIIGTNVGGCSEIINDSTGILIDKDINPKEVSEIIMRFFSSNKNTEEFRNGVFNFWKENFSKNEFKFLSKF